MRSVLKACDLEDRFPILAVENNCIVSKDADITVAFEVELPELYTVTAVEYVSGCLFNLRLKLNVWDYSEMPFNLSGQVCLLYTVLWGFLSATAMPLYRFFRRKLETGRFFPLTNALES